jgi:mono/diheme cytochrome c family protein
MRDIPYFLGTLAAAGLVVFTFLQVVPYGHEHTNPPVVQEPQWDAAETRALARRACFDCHSNETQWPAYADIAPVSWLVQRDVTGGRAALNFSEWHRPQREAHEAAGAVLDGEMPMRVYALMHAHARLSEAERQALAAGLARTLGARGRARGHAD